MSQKPKFHRQDIIQETLLCDLRLLACQGDMPGEEQETAAAVDLVESIASSSFKLDELYSKMDLNQDGRQAMHP